MKNGLPKTAIEAIEPIIRGALADQAWAEATKGYRRARSLSRARSRVKPEEKIRRLEAS